jgi:hypothetical protein
MTYDPDNYSTEKLLEYAYMMLSLARRDQINKTRKNDWLIDNESFDLIGAKLKKIKEVKGIIY